VLLVQDSLLNKTKSEEFVNIIKQIVAHEDKLVELNKIMHEIHLDPEAAFEQDGDHFFDLKQRLSDKLKDPEMANVVADFKGANKISAFIPFWYVPYDNHNDSVSRLARSVLGLDAQEAKIVS